MSDTILPRCTRPLTPAEERHRAKARRWYMDKIRHYHAVGRPTLHNHAHGTMYEVMLALLQDLLRWEDIPPGQAALRY